MYVATIAYLNGQRVIEEITAVKNTGLLIKVL